MKVSDFALMLELNKRTEQVAHLKEASVLIWSRANVLTCVTRWSSSPRTGCSREGSHTDLLPGSSTIAQICNCSEMFAGVLCKTFVLFVLSKIIIKSTLPVVGPGIRRTGLELRVLQGIRDWPPAGRRKLARSDVKLYTGGNLLKIHV